jgi:hypothetical protein
VSKWFALLRILRKEVLKERRSQALTHRPCVFVWKEFGSPNRIRTADLLVNNRRLQSL